MLTCENIGYSGRFGRIGFSLIPGALLAVYGEDATGLIMLMAGKITPTMGNITFEDASILRNKEYKSLSLFITDPPVFRLWETVEKAVTRLAKAGGGAAELVEAALRYWGLTEHRHASCKTLSNHLKKRVILTQLLTLPRPIWLLDHPETGLDAEGLGMLDAVIANRCNQDGIVVMATRREGFMTPLPALYIKDFS